MCADAFDGAPEVLHEDNVAIDVTQQLVPRDGLRARKHIIQPFCAPVVALDVRFVAHSKFLRGFRGAFVIPEEDDFDLGVEACPGLNRVTLDDASVAAEGFRGGEEGQHRIRNHRRSVKITGRKNRRSKDRPLQKINDGPLPPTPPCFL